MKPEQVYAALGVNGQDEVTLEHLPTIFGMFQAIKNGEETVESLFTNRGVQAGKAFDKVADPLNDGDAKGGQKAAAAKKDPAAPGFGENGRTAGEGAGTKPQAGPAPKDASAKPATAAAPDDDAQAQWQRVQDARAAGIEAGKKPNARRNAPSELKGDGREDELDAWLEGFDLGRAGGSEG